VKELDLQGGGISTVVWATGYAFDFNLVKLPVRSPTDIPSRRSVVESPPEIQACTSRLPGRTTEDREFCSVSEPNAAIWQNILPSRLTRLQALLREIGLVMDTRRGLVLNNVTVIPFSIDRHYKEED